MASKRQSPTNAMKSRVPSAYSVPTDSMQVSKNMQGLQNGIDSLIGKVKGYFSKVVTPKAK